MAKQISTILSLKDRMSSPLKKTQGNVKKTTREIKRSQNQIKRWKKDMITSFKNVATRSAKAGGAIAAAVTGLAAKTGFSEAMDMEGYKTQLTTAVKDTEKAGELMSSAIKYANKTPFETGQVVEATSTMEMYGISSKKWLSDIADMAGATNKDMMQATEAMVDVSTGEFERLKEFGIRKDELMLASSKKFGEGAVFNTKGQVVDQQKLMDVLQETMQTKFEGGAEKLSQTSKGMWSTIKGVTKTSLAKIVGMQEDGTIEQGSLMDTLKDKIGSVAEKLQEWQEDGTIDSIKDKLQTAFEKVGDVVDDFKEGLVFVKDNMDVLLPTVTGMATALGALMILQKLNGLYTVWKTATATQTTMQWLLNNALLASPLTWIALAIGAVVAAGVALYMNWDVVKAKALELWQRIKEAWSNLVESTREKWESIKQKVLDAVEGLKEGWNEGLENIKTKLTDAVEWIKEKWEGVKEFFKNPIKGTIDVVKSTVEKVTSGDGKKEFARGGIAREASIFGEAGPEMAIPLKRNSPRSKMLLEKTDRIINGSNRSGSASNSVNVNIAIQGNVIGNKQFVDEVGTEVYRQIRVALSNV